MSRDIHFNLFSQQSCSGKKEHWAGLTVKKRSFLFVFIISINALLKVLWEVDGNSSFFHPVYSGKWLSTATGWKRNPERGQSWENRVFIGVSIKWAQCYWESAGMINIGRHAWLYVCIPDHTCRNLASASWFWGQRSSTWHNCISHLV